MIVDATSETLRPEGFHHGREPNSERKLYADSIGFSSDPGRGNPDRSDCVGLVPLAFQGHPPAGSDADESAAASGLPGRPQGSMSADVNSGAYDWGERLGSDALCFPHRVPVEFRRRILTAMPPEAARLRDSLSNLSETQVAALGRLLPSLLCGEESAFHIFWQEGQRLSNAQVNRSRALAYRIAGDELEHERLLQQLRSCCPVPDDIASILPRTRQFFLRIASRDPAVHFARVAGLDSGVCLILSALVRPLSRATALTDIFDRIRSDEARHVRFSRQRSYELGANTKLLANTATRIRSELVALLYPLGHSFEDLGVDADHLFRRVNAQNALA